MASNADVLGALAQIEAEVQSRASNQELSQLFGSLAVVTPSLTFDHRRCAIAIAGSILLLLLAIFIPGGSAQWLLIPAFGVGGTAAALILVRLSRRSRAATALQHLYEANLMDLEDVEFDPEDKAEELASRYFEFQRGNYSRDVESLQFGISQGRTGDIGYELIQFHWVDERIITRVVTDDKGNRHEVEERVYDDYYRTALLALIGVEIDAYIQSYASESRGVAWTTSSMLFNRRFRVRGESELVLAKLLKPTLVVLMEQLASEFAGLNFEFSYDGTLLISMHKTHLLDANVDINLQKPAEASRQLLVRASQPRIERLLSVCDEVSRHSINELKRER